VILIAIGILTLLIVRLVLWRAGVEVRTAESTLERLRRAGQKRRPFADRIAAWSAEIDALSRWTIIGAAIRSRRRLKAARRLL
jgi:hypothetical protein